MILYHFTQPDNVQAILRHGLVPAEHFDSMLGYGRNAVWLTASPTLELPECMKALMKQRRPDLYSKDQTWLPNATARFQVRVPSHDRKLVHYVSWLKRQKPCEGMPDIEDELISVGTRDFWVYFGTISPSALTLGDVDVAA
jgi:hypothetical protein